MTVEGSGGGRGSNGYQRGGVKGCTENYDVTAVTS